MMNAIKGIGICLTTAFAVAAGVGASYVMEHAHGEHGAALPIAGGIATGIVGLLSMATHAMQTDMRKKEMDFATMQAEQNGYWEGRRSVRKSYSQLEQS